MTDPASPAASGPSDDPNEPLPLFVFGTLRRGQPNHHYLAGRYERVSAARLPDYAIVGLLMIDRSRGNSVAGELFFLNPGRYAETLRNCDRLEDLPPGQLRGRLYERRRVTVQAAGVPHTAWAYVRPTP